MPRAPSSSPRKNVQLSPQLVRAIRRAQINAEERGDETIPQTLGAFLDVAVREWLERHDPEALHPPGPGRPRKTPQR